MKLSVNNLALQLQVQATLEQQHLKLVENIIRESFSEDILRTVNQQGISREFLDSKVQKKDSKVKAKKKSDKK